MPSPRSSCRCRTPRRSASTTRPRPRSTTRSRSTPLAERQRAHRHPHRRARARRAAPDHALDAAARERLSTVYFPGGKITMLPAAGDRAATRSQRGRECPALSLYAEVDARRRSRRDRDARRARAHRREPAPRRARAACSTRRAVAAGRGRAPATARSCCGCGGGRRSSSRCARPRRRAGRRAAPRVHLPRRERSRARSCAAQRGTPIDTVVSELMIFVNSTWGRTLAESGTPAHLPRAGRRQGAHEHGAGGPRGLGVDQYVWASSPLRRYVDLVNQRQLIALARGEAPPYARRRRAPARDHARVRIGVRRLRRVPAHDGALLVPALARCRKTSSASRRPCCARTCAASTTLPLVVRVPSLPALAAGHARARSTSRASIFSISRSTASSAEPQASSTIRCDEPTRWHRRARADPDAARRRASVQCAHGFEALAQSRRPSAPRAARPPRALAGRRRRARRAHGRARAPLRRARQRHASAFTLQRRACAPRSSPR